MNLSRLDWRAVLAIATVAMLVQQAFSYACQMVMPFLADRLAEDFGISRGWLGFYLFIQNLAAIFAAMGCGGVILRLGPLRVSQLVLVLMASSIMIISTGILWIYPVAAILLGLSAVSTPASSHILARVCPPRLAPLIFSVKQTGVPFGSLIGGLLLPFLLGLAFYSTTLDRTVEPGTYGTAFIMALIVIGIALALQPIRAYFDADRRPDTKVSLGDFSQTLRTVVGTPALRDIAFAALAFGGLQSLFAGFFILYLVDGLEFSEVQAGSAYAIASVSAIAARIVWGLLAGTVMTPRHVMAAIGLVGGLSSIALTRLGADWALWEITAIAVAFNMTAISWHGVLLAETARLAPEGQVGGITGGVLSFTSIAMMIYPAVYGVLLATLDSYRVGFAIASLPAFAAFAVFLRAPAAQSRLRPVLAIARASLSVDGLVRLMYGLLAAIGLGLMALGVVLLGTTP